MPHNHLKIIYRYSKLVTNSKSIALLSAVPEFSDEFISIPASEPNLPTCPGDLNSDSNRDLTHEEQTAQCECVADELVVQEVRHCILK